jgi:hypothetical protein
MPFRLAQCDGILEDNVSIRMWYEIDNEIADLSFRKLWLWMQLDALLLLGWND